MNPKKVAATKLPFTPKSWILCFFSGAFLFFSCQNADKVKPNPKKSSNPEKTASKTPTTEIKNEGICSNNAVAFLKDYGQKNKATLVQLHTSFGTVTLRLFEDTPLHRASFLYLTQQGYFDTTCFYRIVSGFIVQGGNSDRLETAALRNKFNQYRIPAEFRKNRKHVRGSLAAARDWNNNPKKKSTPFEFYLVQSRKPQAHLDFEHTVFGEVIEGMEIIDAIANVPVDAYEWPKKDLLIKMTLLKK